MSETNDRLTTCPDCGGDISKMATVCPHCGAPLAEKEKEKVVVQVEQKKEPNGCGIVAAIFFLIVGIYFFMRAMSHIVK